MVHHTVAGRLPERKPFLVRSLNSIDSAQMRIINTTSPFVAASCRQMYKVSARGLHVHNTRAPVDSGG